METVGEEPSTSRNCGTKALGQRPREIDHTCWQAEKLARGGRRIPENDGTQGPTSAKIPRRLMVEEQVHT